MKTNVEVNAQYTKTYAIREAAIKAGDKVIEKYKAAGSQWAHANPRFIVSATPCGRFSPIFINTGSDMMFFVNNNFMVAG